MLLHLLDSLSSSQPEHAAGIPGLSTGSLYWDSVLQLMQLERTGKYNVLQAYIFIYFSQLLCSKEYIEVGEGLKS